MLGFLAVIMALVGLTLSLCIAIKKGVFTNMGHHKKQIIIGVLFSLVSIFASELGTGLRDTPTICAGLFFGPMAGAVSGVIAGLERSLALLWGDSIFTQVASTVSVMSAGLIGGAFHKYFSESKSPSYLYGILAVFITKLVHMFIMLVVNHSDLTSAFIYITKGAYALLAANSILIAFAICVVRIFNKKNHKQKQIKSILKTFQMGLLGCIVMAFMMTFLFTSNMQSQIAEGEVKELITLHLQDVKTYAEDTGGAKEELFSSFATKRIGKQGGILAFNGDNEIVAGRSEIQEKMYAKEFEALNHEIEEEMFEANIAGTASYCISTAYAGYTFVGYVSVEEALYFNEISTYLTTFIEILIFVMLYVIIFFLIKRIVVNNINTINRDLQSIANGHIDVLVDVRSHKEFDALSNYINTTVSTLKDYIQLASERIEKELVFARDIQHSALPFIFPPYPERTEFEIYADMFTAKEVGGDFYDFYFVDKNNLAFIMADVSGKGIPAAMYMMVSKTMIKSFAEAGRPVDEVFNRSNRKLFEDNELGMFVTAWMGIIDVSTGVVTYVNAGHNPPLLRRSGGSFTYLKSKANLVLGAMNNITYSIHEVTLEKGDTLFLYTDGITEAIDKKENLYNDDRLCDILNKHLDSDMETLCRVVKNDVDAFIDGAPQFDDITMLAFQYKGASKNMKELEIFATVENISEVTAFVDAELEQLGCSMKAQIQIDIAIDELFGNIAHYAYNPEVGPATVRVEVLDDPLSVIISFIDNGVPYDPLAMRDPDTTLSAEEREMGGLGIFIVKKSMDEITYEYKDGQNILTIKKVL